jgi:hypothetical protein
MPGIRWFPAGRPERTAAPAGSTATTRTPRPARLEHLADPGDRPAGADGADEDIDGAAGVVPDLEGGGPPVDLRVGGVLELVEHHRAGDLAHELFGAGDGVGHEDPRREHDLGAQVAQQRHALRRHRPRHGQHEPVAADGGGEGQPDARVAARGLDQRHPRPRDAAALGVLGQRHAEPVLDAAAGVAHLQLAHHPARQAPRQAGQLDQRRPPHRGRGVAKEHDPSPPTNARPGRLRPAHP